MKRLSVFMVLAALVFVSIGNIAEKVAAGFKSDEKALTIIKNARIAIGGDAAIGEVKSMVIKGKTSKTIKVDGVERVEQGETEIAFEGPDRLMKIVKMGNPDGGEGSALIERSVDLVVVGKNDGPAKTIVLEGKDGEFITGDGTKVIARKVEGTPAETKVVVRKKGDTADFVVTGDGNVKEVSTADGKKFTIVQRDSNDGEWVTEDDKKVRISKVVAAGHATRDNELLRTMLSLLLTAPEGMDVAYTFAGETDVEGFAANAVDASFGGATVKLFFDRSTNLPLGMSYVGTPAPIVLKMKRAAREPVAEVEKKDVVFHRTVAIETGVQTFVRFADYRSTNGVQLPYRWTTSYAGKQAEVFEIATYEVNPANIAEKFSSQGAVKIRLKQAEKQN